MYSLRILNRRRLGHSCAYKEWLWWVSFSCLHLLNSLGSILNMKEMNGWLASVVRRALALWCGFDPAGERFFFISSVEESAMVGWRVKWSTVVINSLMTNACNGWPAPNGSRGKGIQISPASVERHLLPKPCTRPEWLLNRIQREYRTLSCFQVELLVLNVYLQEKLSTYKMLELNTRIVKLRDTKLN